MAINVRPSIVTSGLVLNLDAANMKSYPRSGTTWRDLSGNNLNTSLNNFVGFNALPPTMIFDGADDYGAVPYNSNFNSMTWTIACWIRLPLTPPQSYDCIISRDFYDGVISFYIDCGLDTTNRFRAGTYKADGDVRYEISSTTPLSSRIGLWTNIVIYRTSDYKIGMSINGIRETETTFGSVDFTTTNPSSGVTLAALNLVGSIDRHTAVNMATAQIYNRALSAQEIQQNYNATKTRFGLQ
jgi:hypothetical protein